MEFTNKKNKEKIPFGMVLIPAGDYIMGKDSNQGVDYSPAHKVHVDSFYLDIHEVTNEYIITGRMTEGAIEKVKISLPGLITVSKGINEPRLPSLRGKIKAARAEIEVWSARDIGADESKIGLNGSPTRVVKMTTPEHHRAGQILEGSIAEQVTNLASKLRQAEVL